MRILQAEYAHSPLEFLQLLDLLNYLPGSVLAKADRSSMDWGLETRSPLLNTRIALAGLALQPQHLIQGNSLKHVLRQLLQAKAGTLPSGAKQGFGAAITKGSELERFLMQNAQNKLNQLNEDLQNKAITRWLTTFTKTTRNWNQNSLFSLSIWLDWITRLRKEFPSISVN